MLCVLLYPVRQTSFLPHLQKQNNPSSPMLPHKLNLIYLICPLKWGKWGSCLGDTHCYWGVFVCKWGFLSWTRIFTRFTRLPRLSLPLNPANLENLNKILVLTILQSFNPINPSSDNPLLLRRLTFLAFDDLSFVFDSLSQIGFGLANGPNVSGKLTD